jgi:hypothetical protein
MLVGFGVYTPRWGLTIGEYMFPIGESSFWRTNSTMGILGSMYSPMGFHESQSDSVYSQGHLGYSQCASGPNDIGLVILSMTLGVFSVSLGVLWRTRTDIGSTLIHLGNAPNHVGSTPHELGSAPKDIGATEQRIATSSC